MKKTILITGASSGIGKATTEFFALNGWNVIATMRTIPKQSIFQDNPAIFSIELDVTSPATIEKAIAVSMKKFGKIDVLLNNAGYAQYGIFEALQDEKIRQQFEVNVFGTMNVTRAILPFMRQQGFGSIINITSGSGRFAVPLMSAYNASKFALEGFTESLSYELASQNITVKIIEPGSTSSNFHHRLEESTEGIKVPETYNSYVGTLNKKMEKVRSNTANNTSTPQEIAEAIYRATTDNTNTLRYVAGNDIEPIIKLRTETSEQEYIGFMRNLFNSKK